MLARPFEKKETKQDIDNVVGNNVYYNNCSGLETRAGNYARECATGDDADASRDDTIVNESRENRKRSRTRPKRYQMAKTVVGVQSNRLPDCSLSVRRLRRRRRRTF